MKLIQIHGPIEKFDLIFHRTGPLAGLPRGYGFVTYKTTEHASKAIAALNGKLVGQKHIKVTWAHSAEIVSSSMLLVIGNLHSMYNRMQW